MINKPIKFKYLSIISFYFIACVGPPEPDHGLVENLPAVINTNTSFTYDLRGDNYSIDESIDLSLSLTDGMLASTLIVTDYKNNDTRYDSPVMYELNDGRYIVRNESSGKALKSIKYTAADFSSMLKN